MIINVTGEAGASLQPELAEAMLTLEFESEDMSEAVARTTALASDVGSAFESLKGAEPSPVTETVLLPLSTRSWRPWHQEGHQLPLRHAATCRARLVFIDFQALSSFLDDWSRRPGVTVSGVEWRLTDESRMAQEAALLASAVADAHRRATVLANAAGQARLDFLELSDQPLSDGPAPMLGARMMSADAHAEGIDLTPADIHIDVCVHARFTTD